MAWFNIYHGLKYPYGNGMQYDYTAEFDTLEIAETVAELEAIADYDENEQTMKKEDYYHEYHDAAAMSGVSVEQVIADVDEAYCDALYSCIESKAVPMTEDKSITIYDRSFRID